LFVHCSSKGAARKTGHCRDDFARGSRSDGLQALATPQRCCVPRTWALIGCGGILRVPGRALCSVPLRSRTICTSCATSSSQQRSAMREQPRSSSITWLYEFDVRLRRTLFGERCCFGCGAWMHERGFDLGKSSLPRARPPRTIELAVASSSARTVRAVRPAASWIWNGSVMTCTQPQPMLCTGDMVYTRRGTLCPDGDAIHGDAIHGVPPCWRCDPPAQFPDGPLALAEILESHVPPLLGWRIGDPSQSQAPPASHRAVTKQGPSPSRGGAGGGCTRLSPSGPRAEMMVVGEGGRPPADVASRWADGREIGRAGQRG
jgi:hypothetical protein